MRTKPPSKIARSSIRSPFRLPLCLLLVAGCGHPSPRGAEEPTEPEDRTTLSFGWSPDVRLAVVDRKQTTQAMDDQEAESPLQTVRYVLDIDGTDDGLRVVHRGLWVDELPPSAQRLVGQLDALLPSYSLAADGTLREVELVEEVPDALRGNENAERLAAMLQADAPEPWVRYEWNTTTGAWIGLTLDQDASVDVEIEGAAGRAELTFVGEAECPGPTSVPDTRCVRLRLRQSWDTEPDPLTVAISRMLAEQDVDIENASSQLDVELVVEEATLVPHRETRTHALSARVTPPDAEPANMRWVRESELEYRVVREPSALVADAGLSDRDQISGRWDAYDAAVMARDGRTAAELVTDGTIALYAEARDAAMQADREALMALSPTRRLNALLLRHAVEPERLAELDGPALFAMTVDRGWSGGSTGLRIVDVEVEGDQAVASVEVRGREVPIGSFRRQGGEWKLDLVPMVDQSAELFEQAAQQLEMEEDDFLLHLLEQTTGRVPEETIWDPPGAAAEDGEDA